MPSLSWPTSFRSAARPKGSSPRPRHSSQAASPTRANGDELFARSFPRATPARESPEAVSSRSLHPATVGAVSDWTVSPRSGVAFLDLREGYVALDSVDRLLDALLPYYERKQVSRVVVAVKGRPAAPAEVLINSLKTQNRSRGLVFELQQE